MSNNPYSNVGSVVTGLDYIDRSRGVFEKILHRAEDLNTMPSFVYGLPGIGKTSLAYQLRDDLVDRGLGVLFIEESLAPKNATAASDIIRRISGMLYERLGDDVKVSRSEEWIELESLLRRAKRAGVREVVIINHFCRHFRTDYREDFYDKIASLFELLRSPDCAGVVHVLVLSRRSPEMIQRKTGASFFSGRCQPYSLPPFEPAEILEMCARSRVDVDGNVVYRYSGGYPWLAGLLLREVNSGTCDMVVARENVKQSFNDQYDYVCKFFRDLYSEGEDLPIELKDLGITNGLDCLIWRERYGLKLPADVEDEFEHYGMGRERLPDSMKGLAMYLERLQNCSPLLLKLAKLERDLRRLVDLGLSKYYATSNWFEECLEISHDENWELPKKGKKPDIKATLLRWRDEAVAADPESSRNVLDYSYPDDLNGFIRRIDRHWRADLQRDWKGFAHYFNNDNVTFDKAMRAFGDIRNPAHHCRKPPKKIELEFDSTFGFLDAHLKQSLRELGGA